MPILEEVVGAVPRQIRALLERHGFMIQEWESVGTDWVTIRNDGDIEEPVRGEQSTCLEAGTGVELRQ